MIIVTDEMTASVPEYVTMRLASPHEVIRVGC